MGCSIAVPAAHQVYLQQADFVPECPTVFSAEEQATLARYGRWMEALASGAIAPSTPDQEHFVRAARGFGASDFYLLRRHVLPQTFGVLLTQAAVLVPQFILAEVTLSFLGLGVSEPMPSWGNMLASLQQYHVLASYWWMFLPGLALVPFFFGYLALAGALHERVGATSI